MNAMWRSSGSRPWSSALASCGDDAPTRADVVASMTDEAVAARYAAVRTPPPPASARRSTAGAPASRPMPLSPRSPRCAPSGWSSCRSGSVRWTTVVPCSSSTHGSTPTTSTSWSPVTEPVDATSLRDLAGADQRGLGAVEHLAAGERRRNERASTPSGPPTLVVDEGAALADDWATFGPTLAGRRRAGQRLAARHREWSARVPSRWPARSPDTPGAEARLAGARWVLLGDGDEIAGLAPLLADATVEQLAAEFDAADAMALRAHDRDRGRERTRHLRQLLGRRRRRMTRHVEPCPMTIGVEAVRRTGRPAPVVRPSSTRSPGPCRRPRRSRSGSRSAR